MAAFPALDRSFRQDEADGLIDRSLAIAGYAVQWKITSDPYAGGNMSYERLADRGLRTLGLDTTTVRGRFAITEATPSRLVVTGVSERFPGIGVRAYITDYDVDSSIVDFDGGITLD
ncbi:hypothetical protein [Rubrivirga sp.]|uniref:hypothetical protein n=1 Tax=Rubrivirga sp. TaxID=1885344 RepID=UPI003C78635B